MALLWMLGTAGIVSQETCPISFVALGRQQVYGTNPVGQTYANGTIQAKS